MTIKRFPIGALAANIASAQPGDTLVPDKGTVVLNGAGLGLLKAHGVTIVLNDDGEARIVRMQLNPNVYGISLQRIKAMDALGLTGDFGALSKTDQARVTASLPADYSDIKAKAKPAIDALGVVRDGMLYEVNPPRIINFTYNGKAWNAGVHWGSGQAKGILNINTGVMGTTIFGGRWQNGRQEGSSYNGSAIRAQGLDLWIEGAGFEACEDGILTGSCLIGNPNGEFYIQDATKGRADLFGFHVDKNCWSDMCGAGGQAHHIYDSEAIVNLSAGHHVKRVNGGNALKMHGGLINVILGAIVDDALGGDGMLQAADFDSGACYVINSKLTKQTKGTGNYGSVVLARNQRNPLPDWLENVFVVRGNQITWDCGPKLPSSFARAINAAAYQSGWPGTPLAIVGKIGDNVFICKPDASVNKTPLNIPATITAGKNPIFDIATAVPDLRIDLPNYALTRQSFREELRDLIEKVDPGRKWADKITSLTLYPSGTTSTSGGGSTSTGGTTSSSGSTGGDPPKPSTGDTGSTGTTSGEQTTPGDSGGDTLPSSGGSDTTAGDPGAGQPTTGDPLPDPTPTPIPDPVPVPIPETRPFFSGRITSEYVDGRLLDVKVEQVVDPSNS